MPTTTSSDDNNNNNISTRSSASRSTIRGRRSWWWWLLPGAALLGMVSTQIFNGLSPMGDYWVDFVPSSNDASSQSQPQYDAVAGVHPLIDSIQKMGQNITAHSIMAAPTPHDSQFSLEALLSSIHSGNDDDEDDDKGKKKSTTTQSTTQQSRTATDFSNSTLLSPSSTTMPKHNNNNNLSSTTIFCLIPYVWNPQSITKRTEILATWGQRCDRLRFLIDPIIEPQPGHFVDATTLPHNASLPDDVVIVRDLRRPWHNCTGQSECRMIWEKVWRSIILVDETEPKFDWYIKTDWDSYVFPEFVKDYVLTQNFNPHEEHHYFGHKDYHRNDNHTFISGAMVAWSYKTFHALADTFRQMPRQADLRRGIHRGCSDSAGSHEEPLTAFCLLWHHNVTSQHTRNERGQERVMLFDLKFHLTANRKEPWWYWQGKPDDVGELDDCCSIRPFCFHGNVFKGLGAFYRVENQLYGDNTTWIDRPHSHPRVQQYLSAVRQELQKIHE